MIELLEAHRPLWEKIHPSVLNHRLAQALLFVGPRHAGAAAFVNRLMALLLCQDDTNSPCGDCRSCRLLRQGGHPDVTYIQQESVGSAVKIDQVRELQSDIYQTPHCGMRRFVVIHSADRMNVYAANAILKILEEPPSHTTFFLIAEQVSTILPTILSRCQMYLVPTSHGQSSDRKKDTYLMLGALYPEDSSRGELFKQCSKLISHLVELMGETMSPPAIAAQWSVYALEDLVWFLYLVTTDAIALRLLGDHGGSNDGVELLHFSQQVQLVHLFNQLEKINAIVRNIHHNVSMNPTLVIEHLLLGFLGEGGSGFERDSLCFQ